MALLKTRILKMNKLYYYFSFSILAASAILLFGCGAGKGSITAAREAMQKKEYYIAADNYRKVYSNGKMKKDEKIEAATKAAECYWLMNDMKSAESWYKKSLKIEPKNSEAQLYLARALKANAKFEEAIVEFRNYQNMVPSDTKVEKEVKGCENALKWKNEKTRYVVENVKSLNTRWSDFSATWFKKDQLFFTSDREKGSSKSMYGWTGNMYTDLYKVSYKLDRKNPNNITYQLPDLVDKDVLNGKFNDGTNCFDSKFTTIFITKCNYDNNGKGHNCRIYTSSYVGSEWSAPEPMPFSTDSFTCGHPSLNKDGSILYFASDMPGGYGGKDIWMVTYAKRGKAWSDPVNLGPVINTEGDDMFPFIHEDGTLFFSSNGHSTLGGQDIFYSTGAGTDWSDPINMKSPINSSGDDFSIVISKDKDNGYFSSNRDGGKGQDDIYRFYMNPLVFTLSGVVRNQKTRELMPNSIVTITSSSDTGKIVLKTDKNGSYKLTLKEKTDYELFAAKENFFDSKMAFQSTKPYDQSMDLIQDFDLIPFPIEDFFTLEGIYYGLDSADLRPESRLILDTLVMTLNKYPKVRIELGSHTDCRADSLYNIGLSQRRADSAVNYIISKGIDPERLVAHGYGENSLALAKCKCEGPNEKLQGRQCTEAEHQLNRRTTVKFLDMNYVPKNQEPAKPEPEIDRRGRIRRPR